MKKQNHLQVARHDLESLKKKNEIPPKMRVKLDYLLASLLDQKSLLEKMSDELPDYERTSLEILDKETKIQLFVNIVNCLSGKDVILYFKDEKAYIRKDQTFSMWDGCYISLDSNTLSVRKKPEKKVHSEFQVNEIRISRKFKEYKRKIVFGFIYKKKHNYLLGFNQESACARIHQILRNLIREKVGPTNSSMTASQVSIKKEKIEEEYPVCEKIVQTGENIMVKSEQNEEQQEKTYLFQNISRQELILNEQYVLIKNCQNGRFYANSKYPNKIKIVMMLKNSKPINILQSFVQMKQWNPQIQQCLVKTRLSDNHYLTMIKFKKFSYLSWQRYAMVVVSAATYEGKHYLSVKNVEEEGDNDSKDMVKMSFNQLLEITTSTQNKDINLLTLITDADHRGYCSVEDSKNMSLKFLSHLESFPSFLQTQQIAKYVPKYFNFEKKSRILKEISQEPMNRERRKSSVSEYDLNDKISLSASEVGTQKLNEIDFEEKQQIDFASYTVHHDQNVLIDEKLVKLIKIDKMHEKYYLKHLFDQEPHIDLSRNEYQTEGIKNYMLQNGSWKIDENEDFIFTDPQVLKVQKGIIKYILKQLGSNLIAGKSVMNMSLPVQIFEKKSLLQTFATGFGFAAKYLVPAAETQNLIEQAKYVTQFFTSASSLHLTIAKPFNPILGETFEGIIGGIPIYMEQISHHPPISALYMKTDTFRFYGNFHSHVELGLNTATGGNLTPLFVEFFNTKTLFQMKSPDVEIGGTMFGDRKYRICGKMFIYERTNNLWTEISFGKEKKKIYTFKNGKIKPANLVGGIYEVNPSFGERFLKCEVKKKFQGVSLDDIVNTHVQIQGHWAKELYFNGEKVRSMEDPAPNRVEYPKYNLPSDSNLRLDIIYKRMENMKQANEEKEVLENLQRRDRKLRAGQIKQK